METKIFNMNGTENGSITLNDEVFAVVAHPQNINDIVKSQLNNERLGTVNTLTKTMETKRHWSCKTGRHQVSTSCRWWYRFWS